MEGQTYLVADAVRVLNAAGGPRERVWQKARETYRTAARAMAFGDPLTAADLEALAVALSVLDMTDGDLLNDVDALATSALVRLVMGDPNPFGTAGTPPARLL